jgi:hypothetical protein
MAEIKSFPPARLVCGIISAHGAAFDRAEARLAGEFGEITSRSPRFPFDVTDYYEPEMGAGLRRGFVAFLPLVDPAGLAEAKIRTNALEREISTELGTAGRIVNLDPGCLTTAALIMATAKDFAHRIPMRDGIYGHLELLFTRTGVRLLEWTYPDFRRAGVQEYFAAERRRLLAEMQSGGG